jgi:hypothetical protein
LKRNSGVNRPIPTHAFKPAVTPGRNPLRLSATGISLNPAALFNLRLQKYLREFATTDLHFFLGTTKQFHSWTENPWAIIGVFPIPHEHQAELLWFQYKFLTVLLTVMVENQGWCFSVKYSMVALKSLRRFPSGAKPAARNFSIEASECFTSPRRSGVYLIFEREPVR